jgi:hypothetical protein
VLASPGFFGQTPDAIRDMAEVLSLAIREHIAINVLDTRGLYTGQPDASSTGEPSMLWLRYRRESDRADSDVLSDIAEGTGGTFFHDNGDWLAGFSRLATTPEFTYVLGFVPTHLKQDGSFHKLRVRVTNGNGLIVEARRGYYALTQTSEEQEARNEVNDAVFSRDQMNQIPVILQTGYSKPQVGDPKVMIVAKVEVKSLHVKRESDRNRDSLIMVSALFGEDGSYLTGTLKRVNLRLRDETLASRDAGVTLRSEFSAKPGTYWIRLVVRESGSKAMTTYSRPITIP